MRGQVIGIFMIMKFNVGESKNISLVKSFYLPIEKGN